jgi:predicted nuclease of restriction endonuclease-like (RecB) superfamily
LPWWHNVILLEKLKVPQDRLWYARQALEHGWSSNVLALQIQSGLHRRQGKALTNFKRTLPPPQSDLAQQALKGDYALDFLKTAKSRERDIERSMVENVQSFLLELGAGFAFVGRQHRLEVGGEEFYLDLLFYHLHLHCYIVIELKAGAFRPEHAGKMSFYLSAADDLLRRPEDGPTIGIILCRSKNKIVAEYALRDSNKPIGVSSYQRRSFGATTFKAAPLYRWACTPRARSCGC